MGIFGDDFGHAARHQLQSRAVLILSQQRNCFASKAADLPIRQDGLQPVTDFDPVVMVVHRQQNEHAAIVGFRSDAPRLVQRNRVALNVRTVG
jgi:hypothetical protein